VFLLLFATTAASYAATVVYDPQAVQAIVVTQKGLAVTVAWLDARRDLFTADDVGMARLPGRNVRLALWQYWQGFLDRMLALDRLSGDVFSAYRTADGDERQAALRVAYAAFLAQYRQALDFIAVAERNPAMHTVLNEPVPEPGLP
jgi:hypothetical protein